MGFTLLDPVNREQRRAQAFLVGAEQARQDEEDWQRIREKVLGLKELPPPPLKLVWVNPKYE